MGEPATVDYKLPLHRPPNGAASSIIQATIGFSFNRCTFCSMYKSRTFRARPLAEDPARPIIFRSNHASNCLPLLLEDCAALLARIALARAGAPVLRPELLRGLQPPEPG